MKLQIINLPLMIFFPSQSDSSTDIFIEDDPNPKSSKVSLETKLWNGTEEVDAYLVPISVISPTDPTQVIVAAAKTEVFNPYLWMRDTTVPPTNIVGNKYCCVLIWYLYVYLWHNVA